MITISKRSVRSDCPKRPKSAHKGTFGRVLIISGSRGMVGAGILASYGAIKSGAGLVRLATVKSQQVVAAKRCPLEVTTVGLPETQDGLLSSPSFQAIRKLKKNFDPTIVALGPGLGQSPKIRSLVKKLLGLKNQAVVLDADGLNALAKFRKINRKGPMVLTPHPSEMARLLKTSTKTVQKNRPASVLKAAKKFKCICVLKGSGSLISDGRRVYKNTTGNSGMASAGTGDVLTGMIAGFWAQYEKQDINSGFKAARLGVHLHGTAGDFAARKKGFVSLTATDLIGAISTATKVVFKNN